VTFRYISIALVAVCLAACASTMSEDDCAAADWHALGEIDGALGETFERFSDRAKACANFGFSADQTAYDKGRIFGLTQYCTPESGFDTGRRGASYRGVCPAELEGPFLVEFEIGKELYHRQYAYDQSITKYDEATKSLERHKRDLRNARNRYRDDNLSNEDREIARQDIDYHRREIDALKYNLPLLEADIDRTGAELDDYRHYLTRQGRPL